MTDLAMAEQRLSLGFGSMGAKSKREGVMVMVLTQNLNYCCDSVSSRPSDQLGPSSG